MVTGLCQRCTSKLACECIHSQACTGMGYIADDLDTLQVLHRARSCIVHGTAGLHPVAGFTMQNGLAAAGTLPAFCMVKPATGCSPAVPSSMCYTVSAMAAARDELGFLCTPMRNLQDNGRECTVRPSCVVCLRIMELTSRGYVAHWQMAIPG
jgi:hypothetical protein